MWLCMRARSVQQVAYHIPVCRGYTVSVYPYCCNSGYVTYLGHYELTNNQPTTKKEKEEKRSNIKEKTCMNVNGSDVCIEHRGTERPNAVRALLHSHTRHCHVMRIFMSIPLQFHQSHMHLRIRNYIQSHRSEGSSATRTFFACVN